ncbi:hypothetical protein GCM10027159_21040 [Lysobacter terrae]
MLAFMACPPARVRAATPSWDARPLGVVREPAPAVRDGGGIRSVDALHQDMNENALDLLLRINALR